MAKLSIHLGVEDVEKMLAGDDPEATLTLRNTIVQEFARRHLKAVVNEPRFEQFVAREERECSNSLRDAIAKYILNPKDRFSYLFAPLGAVSDFENEASVRAREMIQTLVDQANGRIDERIREATEHILCQIDTVLDDRLKQITTNYIDKMIEERLSQLKANAL